MADTAVAVTAGSGTNIDTRTEGTNGNHRQVVVLGDPATNAGVAPVDATAGLKVDLGTDNDVTVTSIAAGDNNIGNIDIVTVPADPFGANADAAATAGSTGSIQAKLRLATSQLDAIKTAVETLDNTVGGSELQVDVVGALPAGTNAIGKLAANSGVDIGDVDVTSAVITGGATAHDAADAGNPLKIGAKAETALSGITLTADGDRTDLYAGVDGVLFVREDSGLEDKVSGSVSNTDGASTQVLAASGAGVKTYLTDVTIANTSSSNIYVELKDGTSVKWTFPVPANGGVTHTFRTPIGGTANTAWNFDPSAATTTVYCSAAGFKSKI